MIKTDPYNDNTPDLVENFGGINIVSKTPTYLDINGNITTDYVYYTDAEYKALPAAEKALYKKSTKINGVTYHYANRAGWYVDPEASPEAIKGGNSYTKNQFTNDVALRNSLPAEIEAIQADITNQTNTINEKQQLINENEAKISKYTNQINDYTATKNEITNAMAGLQEIKQTIVEEIAALKADIQVLEDKIDELLAQKDQLDEVIEQHTEMKAEYQAIYDAKVSEISDLKADVEAAVADLEVQKREIEDVITTAVQDESVIVEQSGDTYNPFALDEAKVPLFLADTNETAQGEVGTGDGAIQISDFQHEQAPALETVSPELAVVDVEIPEADLEPVIIEDEEVAKYAVLHRVNWNGTALPFIGTIAGFIGLTKVKKEEEQ
jgi:hypothetical protein